MLHRLAARLALALLLAPGALLGCPEAPDPGPRLAAGPAPRLVLVYAPCTVSKRFLSPYAPEIPFTPALDAFARESLVFERHQSEAALSGIAYASILTGRHAPEHGVHTHPRRLRAQVVTLPEHLARAGYETYFYDGHAMASASLGYGQGVAAERVVGDRLLAGGDRDLGRILERLQREPDYRAFVMAFFSVSHAPYATGRLRFFCARHPERCTPLEGETSAEVERHLAAHHTYYTDLAYDYERTAERLELSDADGRRMAVVVQRAYESRIALLDELFGGVLADIREAGLDRDSLVVFTADHGEILAREDGILRWAHGHALAPEALGVPLLIRGAGLAPGRFAGVTGSADLLPTLLDLLGLPAGEPGRHGASRARELREGRFDAERVALSHSAPLHTWPGLARRSETRLRKLYPDEDPRHIWVAARRGDWWTRWRSGEEGFRFEAYDLASDPDATDDRFSPSLPPHRALRDRLEAYKEELVRTYVPSWEEARGGGVSEERQRQLLRSLGYVAD